LQLKKLLGILLTSWLACGSFSLDAKTTRRAAKPTPSKSSKTVSASKSKKKAATSAKSRRSSRSGATTTRARRVGPPRQAQPSTERYIEIQQALAAKGYYTGEINGVWDADCVAALKRFQAEQNLTPDGKLGALSLIALGLGPKREPLPPQFAAKPGPGQ
jgi:peptidoglycan hydrolase-like protein with peptidoglycan-binding domain